MHYIAPRPIPMLNRVGFALERVNLASEEGSASPAATSAAIQRQGTSNFAGRLGNPASWMVRIIAEPPAGTIYNTRSIACGSRKARVRMVLITH